MAKKEIKEELEILESVEVLRDGSILIVKGPKGEVRREINIPQTDIKIENGKIIFHAQKASKREYKLIKTYMAHLKNMMKGVKDGHEYKLKILSSHFPMQVSYKNNVLEIKNFIGEKYPRTMKVPEGVDLKIDGQLIILRGIDKELLGQTASRIELLTRRTGFDLRKFQDGIYIIEKDGKKII